MSALDEVLKKHRQRIIDREERAIRELLDAYAVIERELRQSIGDLQRKIAEAKAAGIEISKTWLQRERRLAILIDQVKDQIVRFGSTATAVTMREQRAAIEIAVSQTDEIFSILKSTDPASPNVLGTQLDPRVIEDAVGMMGDGSPIIDYYRKKLAPKVAEAIRVEVIKGVATGTDFRTIADRLFRTGQITKSRALATARTEVNRVRRETTRAIYQDNSDIISGWEWVASKSRRTCPACLAQDGKVYTLDDEFPQHINCRCTLIPVIIGLPRRPRTLGRDWFDKQPIAIKEEILGKEAADAYIRGDITLDDLVGWKPSGVFGHSVYTKPLSAALLQRAFDNIGPTTGAQVVYRENAKEIIARLLGRKISETNLGTLVGALDDSIITAEPSGSGVFFQIEHQFIASHHRYLQRDADGDLYLYNAYFFAAEDAPKGLAKISFPRQAFKAQEYGIKYIKTEAAGDYSTANRDEEPVNGYYTWARFGYNGPLSPEERKFFQSRIDTKRKIYDINDLMRAGGKDLWLRHGSGRLMVFRLDGRAKSMRILKDYVRENARK